MNQHWRAHDASAALQQAQDIAGVPGKVTLTSGLRLKSSNEVSNGNAASAESQAPASFADPFDFSPSALAPSGAGGSSLDIARAGFSGAASEFPHRAAIEQSFGASLPASAYLDGAAARASSALGAHGYALGNQVAFASASPELAVAAHEAAHVMQATSGVQLYGGDSSYEGYEAHADAVADRVVRGESAADLLGAGPVAASTVRMQQHPATAATATNPQAPQASATGAANPIQRVRTAIAAGDVPALVALQNELRRQQTPATPNADIREALKAARQWEMERIASIRDSYAARITAAHATTSAEAPHTGNPVLSGPNATNTPRAGEILETSMDTDCTPFLDALMAGDPQERYLHNDPSITEKVFDAVRLHASRRGLAQIGHRGEAEDESRAHGDVHGDLSWCGAFAYTQAEMSGGFDGRWRENMQSESKIRTTLHYGGPSAETWIWAGGTWQALHAYHTARNSERSYQTVTTAPPSGGIRPGDLVLIDNRRGTDPDHIATAVSFDGRYLVTVGGNQGGPARDDQTGVSRSDAPFDLLHNPDPNDARQRDANHQPIPETDDRSIHKHVRVHGIGRWSIVDYERHIYARGARAPVAPPTAAQLEERR
jgi:Domain of unknown function (DUF4157)